jgi:hypothetical protein
MAKAKAKWECPEDWWEWSNWLAAGLHGRSRWRLSVLLVGLLFASGRRLTVTSWLRAAGIGKGWSSYYYFLSSVGRKSKRVAGRLVVLLLDRLPLPDQLQVNLDDTPTKRYGPKVQGADIHHNPTPGPADAKFLYGHIWVRLSIVVRHARWGTIGLPLLALLYVRRKTIDKLSAKTPWTFRTKLDLAAEMVEWFLEIAERAGKSVRVAVDGFYAKAPFLKRAIRAGAVVVSRLRKDAALYDLPPQPKKGQKKRGRPRKYGKHRISLRKRAAHRQGWQEVPCVVYGQTVVKKCKTFLATYRPVGGVIRVVVVREEQGCQFFFCTDPEFTAQSIIEAFADRANIEQVFHDDKEVWGIGQQQLRNVWANMGAMHLNLWAHTLVELWAWNKTKKQLCDRSASPWDDPERRPSHADRRKALRRHILQNHFSAITAVWHLPRKIHQLTKQLFALAA